MSSSSIDSKNKSHRAIGNMCEGWVCSYLENEGYKIVRRNFYTSHGEIDIIAENAKYIVFIEVKARTVSDAMSKYGRPAKAVNTQKRQRLLFSIKTYLRYFPSIKCPRIDVAEVYIQPDSTEAWPNYRIEYFEGAFGENGK